MSDTEKTIVPPIVRQYIVNAFDSSLPIHVRNNYRDNLDKIRDLCSDAVREFDNKNKYGKVFNNKKKN